MRGQPTAALQRGELDEERQLHDPRTALLDQSNRRLHRPPGRQQVIHQQGAIPWPERILVDFQRVLPVLQGVGGPVSPVGQLSLLTN